MYRRMRYAALFLFAIGTCFSLAVDVEASCWTCGDVGGRATCVSAGGTSGKSQCTSGTSCLSSCTSSCKTSGSDCTGSSNCRMIGGEMICEEHKDVILRTPNGAGWEAPPLHAEPQGACA